MTRDRCRPGPRWLLVLGAIAPASGAELVVFAPEAPSNLAVQETLRQDPALAGWSVTVVAKWRALDEAVSRRPALVVGPAALLLEPRWVPVMQFLRNGRRSFQYRVVTLDQRATLGQLQDGSIGLLQEVDPDRVAGFLAGAFPDQPVARRFRLVAKVVDVGQVMALDLAATALVTPAMHGEVAARFPGVVRTLASSRPVRFTVGMRLRDASADPMRVPVLAGLGIAAMAGLGMDGVEPFQGAPDPWAPAQIPPTAEGPVLIPIP